MSQTGISVQGSFKALKWPKIKKTRKQTPPKIQFYQLGGVRFSGQFVDCRNGL